MAEHKPASAAPAAAPRRERVPVAGLWRERLSASLPVLLMAALAAATWWLVRHTPKVDEARPAATKRHEVDYDMQQFRTRRYVAGGRLQTIVEGREMRRYADDGSIEIDDMRLHAMDDGGRRYNGEARLGTADAALRVVQLLGHARIKREATTLQDPDDGATRRADGPLQLSGEQLWMDTQTQRMRSSRPVTMVTDDGRMDAGTLDYDGSAGLTLLGQRVRGSYLPARPGQAASGSGR